MTRRRIVIPGRTWAFTRRTTRRYFLFRPDEQRRVEQAFWYCLAYAARDNGMLIHAALLMSTHPHIVGTDLLGKRPLFLHTFHRLFALCIKAILGWPEEVFSKASTGEHELLSSEAMIESLAYLMANPVAAGAVRYSREWPGAKTLPRDLGRRVVVATRPEAYFDPANPQWPETIELELTLPAELAAEYGRELTVERVGQRLRELEREAWDQSKRRGTPFRGARRVLRTKHTVRASSYQTFGSRNPRFAAAGDARLATRAVAEFRVFDSEYDQALGTWTAGHRDVWFPYGTWWMRVHHGVRCRPPP